MVLIHFKKTEEDSFLYEALTTDANDDVVRTLAELHNKRQRIRRLVHEARELAYHGPAKPEDQQGYSQEEMEAHMQADAAGAQGGAGAAGASATAQRVPGRDPTGRRDGCAAEAAQRATIEAACAEAEQAVSKRQVEARVPTTDAMLQGVIDTIRGAVMIAFPGLPDWDPVAAMLEDTEDLAGTQWSKEVFDPETVHGWFASKELVRDGSALGDVVGRNEKTKIVVKLSKKGGGPPAREAAVDPRTQQEMMAFYHKKAEQFKKLEEDEDDAYENSAWANPKALKNQFNGLSNIRFR
jgi:hypothetical protein